MADNDPKMRVTDPQPFIKLDEDQYDPDPFNTGDVDVPLPPGYGLDDDVTKALDEEMRREEVLDRALAKYDTSSLESKPGKSDNWIEGVGGELPSFVRAVAHALLRGGKPKSQAIGMAIGQCGPEDPMTESFQQMFEQSLAKQQIKSGQVLTGTIVGINADVVIVSVGLKSEAVIPAEQFRNKNGEVDVTIGDEIEVALEAVEDGSGETRLSREKAKRARTWTRLGEAFTKSEIVRGVINGRVKGGFTVELDNVRAFLPGSLVDVRPVRDPSYLEGKELEFKVIKLDQRRNNVVVSRRAVVEQEYSAERSQLLDNLKEGDVVKGAVKNLTDYGAFVGEASMKRNVLGWIAVGVLACGIAGCEDKGAERCRNAHQAAARAWQAYESAARQGVNRADDEANAAGRTASAAGARAGVHRVDQRAAAAVPGAAG